VRSVLITGGSGGIGLAVAHLFATAGDSVVTLVARDERKLQDAVLSLPGRGHDYIVADLSRRHDMMRLAAHLTSKPHDILINNAGVGQYGRFDELGLDAQLEMMALNMESMVILSHHYLRQARTGDTLANTASFLAYSPLPGAAVYSATKAFVATLSETLWWEYRRKGIRILGFSPGVISTNFHKSAGASVTSFPSVLVQSPEEAAEEMFDAIRHRTSPDAVSGVMTRLMLLAQRFVSRKTVINMMGRSSPLRGR
jgi:short-subunit dehydrogenase